MDDLADKQARLAAIKKAWSTGVLWVKHGETTTTFRSLDEMERIIGRLETEIAPRARRRVTYVQQRTKAL